MSHFRDSAEVFAFARQLSDSLRDLGRIAEARELAEVVHAYWSTASEALGALRDSLLRVRSAVQDALPLETLARVDEAVAAIQAAFNRANDPGS